MLASYGYQRLYVLHAIWATWNCRMIYNIIYNLQYVQNDL